VLPPSSFLNKEAEKSSEMMVSHCTAERARKPRILSIPPWKLQKSQQKRCAMPHPFIPRTSIWDVLLFVSCNALSFVNQEIKVILIVSIMH